MDLSLIFDTTAHAEFSFESYGGHMYSLHIDCTALQNLLFCPLNILLLHAQSLAYLYAVNMFATSKL